MHGPAKKWKKDNSIKLKTRLGIWMFVTYSLVYAGFILTNVINPKIMSQDVGDFNLAIVYGFGLIILGLLMALIYNHICTRAEEKMNKDSANKEGNK